MPEEKKPAEAQAVAVEEKKEAKTEDYKSKFKTLQAEQQKVVEQLKSAQGTLDALDEQSAIDWNKLSGGPEPPKEEDQTDAVAKALQRQESRLLTLQFRVDNPDLREYEDNLVVPFVLKAKQLNPRKSQEAILDIASKDVRSFLQTHEEAVLAKQKKAKAAEDAEKVSGLEAGGSTTPEEVVDEQQSRQNYVDSRRKRRAKQIGMT